MPDDAATLLGVQDSFHAMYAQLPETSAPQECDKCIGALLSDVAKDFQSRRGGYECFRFGSGA